jgi:poly(A) polymerase
VRNALLGVAVADVDIATTLAPPLAMACCQRAGFGVHPTGMDHGTITVVNRHMAFEVTTLRRDVTTDGRRATVAFTEDWALDAARRDFTMNALYCDAGGKLYDFTNGYADILRGKVRFVGLPSRRIREDYLRILRFFRFYAQFGRGAADAEGLAACARQRKGLDNLSAERIRQELLKLLVAPRAVDALKVMASAGVLPHVIDHVPAWRVISRLPADALLRLAVLARDTGGLQARLRLSNDEAKRLQAIAEAPPVTPLFRPQERRVLLYHLGRQAYRDSAAIAFARSKAAADDPEWQALLALADNWPIPVFPLSGKDLQANGVAPGPGMGESLRKLEDLWIASDFKLTREELLARAKPRT